MKLERAIDIGLVIHGPDLIDSGKIVDVVETLRVLGPVSALVGGTMARVAALDNHMTFIDTSKMIHTSDALVQISNKDVILLANSGKTLETGTVFGQIVSSRVQRSVIQVERPGLDEGSVILWLGWDGEKSQTVQYVARYLSESLSLNLIEKQKEALSLEEAGDVVARQVHGTKRGEPLFIEGVVVGTVVGDDVSVVTKGGSIIDIVGAATKAHGLEKIGRIDLRRAYIKTGQLRTINKAYDRSSAVPSRALKRGAVVFINHNAESALDSVNEQTICAITVGDDTTAICGDILSRSGIPIIGIIDGDGDGIYGGSCISKGSVIIRLENASDDDVGVTLERATILDQQDHTLADVVDSITACLQHIGVKFVLEGNSGE